MEEANLPDEQAAILVKQQPAGNIARLEFSTALWALDEAKRRLGDALESWAITLVIDCKAIENLLGRRSKLESKQFLSNRTGEQLSNADLYREFFKAYDEMRPEIKWVKGHSPRDSRTLVARQFARVDRAARQGLRDLRAGR